MNFTNNDTSTYWKCVSSILLLKIVPSYNFILRSLIVMRRNDWTEMTGQIPANPCKWILHTNAVCLPYNGHSWSQALVVSLSRPSRVVGIDIFGGHHEWTPLPVLPIIGSSIKVVLFVPNTVSWFKTLCRHDLITRGTIKWSHCIIITSHWVVT